MTGFTFKERRKGIFHTSTRNTDTALTLEYEIMGYLSALEEVRRRLV